jgi:hypothetical protein
VWGEFSDSALVPGDLARYFATMVTPGSHRIVASPNDRSHALITGLVDIVANQTTVLDVQAASADLSATGTFPPGDPPSQNFAGLRVVLDFSAGPGGEVSVHQFGNSPPAAALCELAASAGTSIPVLPHYWSFASPIPDSSFAARIDFSYDDAELAEAGVNEGNLIVARYDTAWTSLATTVNASTNTASVQADRFGYFALGNFAPPVGVVEPSPASGSQPWLSARPNPAPGASTIQFGLPARESITLDVYDLFGRRLRTLARGPCPAGPHTARWDGRDESGKDVAPGVYYCRLIVGSQSITQRIVFVR